MTETQLEYHLKKLLELELRMQDSSNIKLADSAWISYQIQNIQRCRINGYPYDRPIEKSDLIHANGLYKKYKN